RPSVERLRQHEERKERQSEHELQIASLQAEQVPGDSGPQDGGHEDAGAGDPDQRPDDDAGMPAAVADTIVHLPVPKIVILIGILLMYLVLGMFLDGIGMILLTVPIILPTIKQLGIDPIVFGVLVVRMAEIGLITPPVGL